MSESIKLSAADLKQIEDALENAGEPSEKLTELFRRVAVWEKSNEQSL